MAFPPLEVQKRNTTVTVYVYTNYFRVGHHECDTAISYILRHYFQVRIQSIFQKVSRWTGVCVCGKIAVILLTALMLRLTTLAMLR